MTQNWVPFTQKPLWLCDANQSTLAAEGSHLHQKGRVGSSEVQRSLNTIISDSTAEEMVRGSSGQGGNECRPAGYHLSTLTSHIFTHSFFISCRFFCGSMWTIKGYLICKDKSPVSIIYSEIPTIISFFQNVCHDQ